MKKNGTIAVCAILLAVVMLCGGCASVVQNFENEEIRQDTETMLDALIADDFQTAYSLVSVICTEADFAPVFTQMREFLGDVDTYELELLGISSHSTIANGQKSGDTHATYVMTTGDDRIVVNVRVDSLAGMTNFYLTPYEKTDYYHTGTLSNMEEATGMQWILLLSNLLSIGIAAAALVDCCRHKFRKKTMWILLVIFGFVSPGMTVFAGGFRLFGSIGWIFAYSAVICYGSGTIMIRLMLPVGAVCYFFMRRSLLEEKPSAVVICETAPLSPEEEEN